MNFSRSICLIFISLFFFSTPVKAERILDRLTIKIKGEDRHYYRLHDDLSLGKLPVIILINGSGCDDFSERFPSFFEQYPAPLDVYFLEKPYVIKGAAKNTNDCSKEYNLRDNLDRRVSDNVEFIENEPGLKKRDPRSIALLGFSEGGVVAPVVALKSEKIGWLATAGSGGMKQSDEFLLFSAKGIKLYAEHFPKDVLLSYYDAIARDPLNTEKKFFGHPYSYWSNHLFYDPMSTYKKLTIPIVAAMGELDDSVPIESGRVLRDYFAMHPEIDFQFIEYKNASHALQTGGKSNAKIFIANLAKWFQGDKTAFVQSDN